MPPFEHASNDTPIDWAAVETWLESPLPADYKELISAYGGPVEIGDFIHIHAPVTLDRRYDYAEWLLETHRHCAISSRALSPHLRPFLPEPGGLLAFGSTAAYDYLFWDTSASADPDAWPVVLFTSDVAFHENPWMEYEAPLRDVLSAVVLDPLPHPADDVSLGPLPSNTLRWAPLAGARPWSPPRERHVNAGQRTALTKGHGMPAITALVPPPLVPYLGDGSWDQLFERLGTRLPGDYIALMERYGAGCWSNWLPMDAPLRMDRHGVAAQVEWMTDAYRSLRARFPESYPYAVWPEPGGFLPFTSTIDGDQIGWLTTGGPDEWPLLVRPRHSDAEPPLPGGLSGILLDWLRGHGHGEGFPGLRGLHDPLDVMVFQPWGTGTYDTRPG